MSMGFDLGGTLGWALMRIDDKGGVTTCASGQRKLVRHNGRRYVDLMCLFVELCDQAVPDVVSFEEVMFMHRMSQEWNALYHGQIAVLQVVAWDERCMEPVGVYVGEAKTMATGNAQADKGDVIVAVERHCGHRVRGEHEADAIAVAVAAGAGWRRERT